MKEIKSYIDIYVNSSPTISLSMRKNGNNIPTEGWWRKHSNWVILHMPTIWRECHRGIAIKTVLHTASDILSSIPPREESKEIPLNRIHPIVQNSSVNTRPCTQKVIKRPPNCLLSGLIGTLYSSHPTIGASSSREAKVCQPSCSAGRRLALRSSTK